MVTLPKANTFLKKKTPWHTYFSTWLFISSLDYGIKNLSNPADITRNVLDVLKKISIPQGCVVGLFREQVSFSQPVSSHESNE